MRITERIPLSRPESSAPSDRREIFPALACFVLLLFFHAWAATSNWRSTDLPGNGFRQSQTAITALFIQRDHDFSLAYPTPVLGKPWSVPYEFPLYQWTVVGISNATGLPLIQAGRGVSLVCFYLALPAAWLLLARLGVVCGRRLLVLGLVLCCPLYVFYTRAFLIETMALMFSLWFLHAFLAAVERRSLPWLVIANLAGAGAGLVKVTTFLLYLVPAAACVVLWLWRDWRADATHRLAVRTLGWIAAACALPFVASVAWIHFTDVVKLRNPSSVSLSSAGLQDYHFGTWETRLSSGIWGSHWEIFRTNLMSTTILVTMIVLALLTGRRWWGRIAGCLFLFVGIQALFPVLYAIHGYYYVANGILLMIAAGLVLCGLLDSSHPRWVVWTLIAGMYVGQIVTYFDYLHDEQVHRVDGGSGLTDALRALTGPRDVLIVAGEDWASMTPFYAERRALMIRRNMENDVTYQQAAFDRLKGERVGALVLTGAQRTNDALRGRVVAAFGLDPVPAFTWRDRTVYVPPAERVRVIDAVKRGRFDEVDQAETPSLVKREVAFGEFSARQQESFKAMNPAPLKIFSEYGISAMQENGRWFFSAHPVTRLWFPASPGSRRIAAEYMIGDAAYQNVPAKEATDGVEFSIYELKADGTRVRLFTRVLNPVENVGDRGLQKLLVEANLAAGSTVLFETLPGKTYLRDWALWGEISIR